MKKTYMNPTTTVVKTVLTQMIAASDLSGVTETGGTMTLTESQAEKGAAGMARSFNAWGEDEEE